MFYLCLVFVTFSPVISGWDPCPCGSTHWDVHRQCSSHLLIFLWQMPLVFQARSFLAVPVLNPLQELTSCWRISQTPVGGSNFLLTFISWKKKYTLFSDKEQIYLLYSFSDVLWYCSREASLEDVSIMWSEPSCVAAVSVYFGWATCCSVFAEWCCALLHLSCFACAGQVSLLSSNFCCLFGNEVPNYPADTHSWGRELIAEGQTG